MRKWIIITWLMLSLTVLILVILMYLNTMVSFKYEIEPIRANDTIYVEAATRYFKFKIDSLIEFALYVIVNILLMIKPIKKKIEMNRSMKIIKLSWTVLSVTVLLWILLIMADTVMSHRYEVSERISLGLDYVTLDMASGYLKGTILTLKEFALYVLINMIFIVATLFVKNKDE